MPFYPSVNERITLQNHTFTVCRWPVPDVQKAWYTGRKSRVYQLQEVDTGDRYALKLRHARFRTPSLLRTQPLLAQLAAVPGFEACNQTFLTPDTHAAEIARYSDDLAYASLLPWVAGTSWGSLVNAAHPLGTTIRWTMIYNLVCMLEFLERHSIAHTNLSSSNILLEPAAGMVHLLDFDQVYWPNAPRPVVNSTGSPGYRKREASQWSLAGDRFALAVLVAEMLGWHEPSIRAGRAGQSYFSAEDFHNPRSERYLRLRAVLHAIDPGLCDLFADSWLAPKLEHCPDAATWHSALVAAPKNMVPAGHPFDDHRIDPLLLPTMLPVEQTRPARPALLERAKVVLQHVPTRAFALVVVLLVLLSSAVMFVSRISFPPSPPPTPGSTMYVAEAAPPTVTLTSTPMPMTESAPVAVAIPTPTVPLPTPTTSLPSATATPLPTPGVDQEWAALVQQLGAAWNAGDWETVLLQVQTFVEHHPDYAPAQEALFSAHLNYGVQLVQREDADKMDEAIIQFTQALAIKPGDSTAQEQRELANAWVTSSACWDRDWACVQQNLEAIYARDPGYKQVRVKLATVYYILGQQVVQIGSPCAALDLFSQALQTGDVSEASLAYDVALQQCTIAQQQPVVLPAPPSLTSVLGGATPTPVQVAKSVTQPKQPAPPTPMPQQMPTPTPLPAPTQPALFFTGTYQENGMPVNNCGPVLIGGKVTYQNGIPVRGLAIVLRFEGTIVARSFTSINGDYEFCWSTYRWPENQTFTVAIEDQTQFPSNAVPVIARPKTSQTVNFVANQ